MTRCNEVNSSQARMQRLKVFRGLYEKRIWRHTLTDIDHKDILC